MQLVEIATFTDDVEGMGRFYRQLVGAAPVVQAPGICIFDMGGIKLLIHKKGPAGPGGLPSEDHIAFGAPDVDEACRALEAQGFTVHFPPRDYDWGRSAYLRDPSGRLVEVQHMPAGAANPG